jgi:hypothetical protein
MNGIYQIHTVLINDSNRTGDEELLKEFSVGRKGFVQFCQDSGKLLQRCFGVASDYLILLEASSKRHSSTSKDMFVFASGLTPAIDGLLADIESRCKESQSFLQYLQQSWAGNHKLRNALQVSTTLHEQATAPNGA